VFNAEDVSSAQNPLRIAFSHGFLVTEFQIAMVLKMKLYNDAGLAGVNSGI
jgi:hypothetical protein